MRCPWCREGEIVLHGPDYPWTARQHGGDPHAGRGRGRYSLIAVPPCRWFSCPSCGADGTQEYLEMVLSGALARYLEDRRLGLPLLRSVETTAVAGKREGRT